MGSAERAEVQGYDQDGPALMVRQVHGDGAFDQFPESLTEAGPASTHHNRRCVHPISENGGRFISLHGLRRPSSMSAQRSIRRVIRVDCLPAVWRPRGPAARTERPGEMSSIRGLQGFS
jgi:hypothetical protein